MEPAKAVILAGTLLVVLGLIWLGAGRIGLGHLPGDIVIERGNFRFYLPLGTSIVISLLLSAVFWLTGRL
jgi:TM2 domain-containing membrane protein YozV